VESVRKTAWYVNGDIDVRPLIKKIILRKFVEEYIMALKLKLFKSHREEIISL